ncbi:MAG: putative secondary metabolism biosynthetic enzyme [Candelaria pacifica]|nr:MAG: putative secondary metabolism biosynthetic enzyme [Candelaria pacifica]
MAPATAMSAQLENGHDLSTQPSEPAVPAKGTRPTQEDWSNATADTKKTLHDVIDVEQIRSHFPILGGETIPFNNAAGTVVLKDSIESASRLMYSMPIDHGDGDPRSLEAIAAYEKNWNQCAAFVNASPDEITFGQSTTILFRLLGLSLRPYLNGDCEMVCSTLCHEASASAWVHLAKDLGVTIKWWSPSRDQGDSHHLSLDSLRPLLSPKTRIVACNHVSNVIGTIHPIHQIADLVHTIPGCIFIVDGVAMTPHRPVDVKALDVDFYCFSWYKVFGPHMAQLYASRRAQDRYMVTLNHFFFDPFPLDRKLHLGATTYELEEMCSPIVRYLQDTVGWDVIIKQETILTRILLDYLLSKPGVYRVFGEHTANPSKRVSIVIFEIPGRKSSDVVMQVHIKNRFRITWGDCWAPRPIYDVLKPKSDGIIRVSFVHYNTVSEVKELCDALEQITSQPLSIRDVNGNSKEAH